MPLGFKGIDNLGEESTFSRPGSTKRLIFFVEVMPKGLAVFPMHRSPGRGEKWGELAEFHSFARLVLLNERFNCRLPPCH